MNAAAQTLCNHKETVLDSSYSSIQATASVTDQVPRMQFHPVANIFRMMTPDERDGLRQDIEANGQTDEILLAYDPADGILKIADGRNRYNACRELGIEPKYREWNGVGNLLSIVISKNLHRRHLDETERAMIAAGLVNTNGVGRPTINSANLPNITTAKAADLLSVSPRTVTSALKVLRDGDRELIENVGSGPGQFSIAAAATISDLPKSQQKRIVRRGRKAHRTMLLKSKTKSVQKAFRLGCLNCDTSIKGKATSTELSGQLQRIAHNQPQLAWAIKDIIEEIESEQITGGRGAEESYDMVLAAIRMGYQTEIAIAEKTGFERLRLEDLLANMIYYNMIRKAKELKKTDKARGATKTIYIEVPRKDWRDGHFEFEDADSDDDFPEPDVYLDRCWED